MLKDHIVKNNTSVTVQAVLQEHIATMVIALVLVVLVTYKELMYKVLVSGCKCFNVLHNMIFQHTIRLTPYLLPNSHLSVKVETPLVWTNSQDVVTCPDRPLTKQL